MIVLKNQYIDSIENYFIKLDDIEGEKKYITALNQATYFGGRKVTNRVKSTATTDDTIHFVIKSLNEYMETVNDLWHDKTSALEQSLNYSLQAAKNPSFQESIVSDNISTTGRWTSGFGLTTLVAVAVSSILLSKRISKKIVGMGFGAAAFAGIMWKYFQYKETQLRTQLNFMQTQRMQNKSTINDKLTQLERLKMHYILFNWYPESADWVSNQETWNCLPQT